MSEPTAIDAFYLPAWLAVGMETTVQRFGPPHDSMDLRLPVVSSNDIQRWIEALRQARAERLVNRTTASILRSLDRVATRFLDSRDPARCSAVAALERAGRFSTPMIERCLDDAFTPLVRGGLRKWLTAELGSASALDRPTTVGGAMRAAHGPEWMLHVYAGNVPTVPIWPLLSAPLLKSALLAKTSSQEPILAPLLARTIAEVDPEIGECLAVVWWKGGAAELDRAALSDAPAVLAFGGDVAMASVARQARPGAALVLHGPKLSIGYIGRHALTRSALPKLTARAALDVALYDQQGCLSPHAYYVERRGAVSPVDFAAALGDALESFAWTLPRREPTATEAAAIQMARAQARFNAAAGGERAYRGGVFASPGGTHWTVVCENGARFEPGPAHRSVRVHAIESPEEFERAIAPDARYVEALALEEAGPRRASLAARFAAMGLPRIAAVGALQQPSPLSTHGGVGRLRPFVTWTTVESARPTVKTPARPAAPVPAKPPASKPSARGSRTKAGSRRRSR